MTALLRRLKRDPFDAATLALMVGLVVLLLTTFQQYAISNDEPIQHRYGELIIAYYASGFTDLRVFHLDNLYLYGGLFDIVAVLVSKLLPFDPWAIRHVLCGLIGIGGVAATWATARLIAGARTGMLAALVLALCGVWDGGMFNHTKDIPLASAMMGATWVLLRIMRQLPRPQARDVIGFGILMGAALGLRAMGLLLVGYAGLAIILGNLHPDVGGWRDQLGAILRSGVALIPAFVVAYLIMIASWPWSVLAPLNPIRAIFDFAHLDIGGVATLLAGHLYDMQTVPRWYVTAYLLIKLPLVVFAGAALAVLLTAWPRFWRRAGASADRIEIAFLAFMAVFPVLIHAISHGPAFSGLRHFLFVVPPLAVLAGIGLDGGLGTVERWRRSGAAAGYAALAAILIWPAVILVQLHPYEYLYFNPLAGGLAGADRNYDTDYWVNIMPEAVHGLEAYVAQAQSGKAAPARTYTVGVCGDKTSFAHEQERGSRLRTTEDWDNADFFIAPTQMDCDLRNAGKTILKIERLGALIGVVKQGPGGPPPPLPTHPR
jgi:hypothetical protein